MGTEKMTDQEIMNQPFSIEVHKANFTNYLEVILDPQGTVHYAVPSHQEFMIRFACNRDNLSREALENLLPHEYYCDFIIWLSKYTGCVAVWNRGIIGEPNIRQKAMLKKLKLAGLYHGIVS